MYLLGGGGEEFIILVTNTVEKEAFQVAESLRFFIETKQFSGISKLTASFGVALYEKRDYKRRINATSGYCII